MFHQYLGEFASFRGKSTFQSTLSTKNHIFPGVGSFLKSARLGLYLHWAEELNPKKKALMVK